MPASPPPKPGRIFISYRRGETAYPAGWLYDRLADRYGGGQVFKDVDSIELGDDFVEVITHAVGSCDVLLALIGERLAHHHRCGRTPSPRRPAGLRPAGDRGRLGAQRPRHPDPGRRGHDACRRRVAEQPVQAGAPAGLGAEPGPLRLRHGSAAEGAGQGARRDTCGRVGAGCDAPLTSGPCRPQAPVATPLPERPQRRRRSIQTWSLAGTGIAVVLIVLIVAVLANHGRTPSPSGAASPSMSAGAAAASPPAATATTSPPASAPVLFQDNFSSHTAGWSGDGAVAEGAGYTSGAYRISAPPGLRGSGAGSAPMKASRVWPSAPPQIRMAAKGHRLPESDQGMGYGILCRINGANAYALTISDDYAAIEKFGKYTLLKDAHPHVDPDSTNELLAVCTGGTAREAVHLELWVNGKKVVETTDTVAPLPTGGVGLVVTTYQTSRASVAEFDNFVVEQVA